MNDYISRQAAIDGLKEYFSDEERTETEYGAYWHHIHVLQFLEDIPPADVRPVVRGRWKKNDNGTYSCERCHSWIPEEQRHYANWCLYCGADMRGGDAG